MKTAFKHPVLALVGAALLTAGTGCVSYSDGPDCDVRGHGHYARPERYECRDDVGYTRSYGGDHPRYLTTHRYRGAYDDCD